MNVHDYPDRAVQLFEHVPLVDQEVQAAAQRKARKFIPDMIRFVKLYSFPTQSLGFRKSKSTPKTAGVRGKK